MTDTMTPRILAEKLRDGKEIALIDVREQGVFSETHMLAANCIPLSRMERVVYDLIPRRGTRIVLVDDGPKDPFRLAQTASERLADYGYTDISILKGGIEGWREAGLSLFSGVNVASKAFGEFVETKYDTPRMSAETLLKKIQDRENLVVFDARPRGEFFRMNIPGALNVPGAELVHRFFDLVPDRDTQVVVNCAGRTRSIIGSQSLINAGVPNPVWALKNGTMGWHLSGFDLEHGKERPAPSPSADGLKHAIACTRSVADRFGVRKIDSPTLSKWEYETEARTLYLLDVRSPEEFEAGHLEGARNAPGGQLVQATDEYAVVRNARIVLVDDNEIRAIMTASWLIQMGWTDVFVLAGGMGMGPGHLIKGAHRVFSPPIVESDTISAPQLKAILDAGQSAAVVDLATSRRFQQAHIPGARWAIRSRLASDVSHLPRVGRLILTSTDGMFAHLAAQEIVVAGFRLPVCVLEGGTAAWVDAGFPVEEGIEQAISPLKDLWYKPYERPGAPEKAMQEYLDWEVALVEQVKKDGTVDFKYF
jgi:rhodanese-related sulfurtransferase